MKPQLEQAEVQAGRKVRRTHASGQLQRALDTGRTVAHYVRKLEDHQKK